MDRLIDAGRESVTVEDEIGRAAITLGLADAGDARQALIVIPDGAVWLQPL